MKKSTIWLLTIIMACTFVGLLYVQIMYMENMIKMRNEQFSEVVKRSLYGVSNTLEQDETKHYLEEDLDRLSNFYTDFSKGQSKRFEYSLKSPDGSQDYRIKGTLNAINQEGGDNIKDLSDSYSNMQRVLKGQYLYQQGILNEVILNMLAQSSNRPIEERADSSVVRKYLGVELESNGLDLPFDFALVNRNGAVVYKSANYRPEEYGNVYSQAIFPNDPVGKMNYLKVTFPTKNDYIFSSIKFMIPSFAF